MEPQILVLRENTIILLQSCFKEHLKLADMQQKYRFKILDKNHIFTKALLVFLCGISHKNAVPFSYAIAIFIVVPKKQACHLGLI